MVSKYSKQNKAQKRENLRNSRNRSGSIITESRAYDIRNPAEMMEQLFTNNQYKTRYTGYADIAKKRDIKSIKKDKFVLVDGLEMQQDWNEGKMVSLKPGTAIPDKYMHGEGLNVSVNTNDDIQNRQNMVGRYNTNNGVLAFVDEHGDLYAAPYTPALLNLLKKANYEEVDPHQPMPVPLSATGKIADPELRKRWMKDAFRVHNIKSLESSVAKVASIIGVIGGIIFLSPNLTGNVIAEINANSSSLLGAILLGIGLVGTVFWIKKK